jgi:AcrR family transcriptional regulator
VDETKRFRFIWCSRARTASFCDAVRDPQRRHDSEGIVSATAPEQAARAVARPRIEGDREAEILDATLELLAAAGYDRLTMDAVAAAAKASKATLYRRWSTKADLVIDAIERAKSAPYIADLDTGTLRGDLIASACHEGGLSDSATVSVLAGIIPALHHDQEFADAFQERFLKPKFAQTRAIYERARARGEIADDVDLELLETMLPALALHRAFVLRQPVDEAMIARIVDEVVLRAAAPRPDRSTARKPASDPKSLHRTTTHRREGRP